MEPFLVVSSVLLWILVVFNLLLTFALIRRLNNEGKKQIASVLPEGLKVNEHAPTFQAETLDGQLVSLSTFSGRDSVFLFIAPHCGPCRESLPGYAELAPIAAQSGVEFVLVCDADSVQTRAFAEEFQITLPILSAPRASNTFFPDYKVAGTPSFYLIDKNGIVQAGGYPSRDWGDWKKYANLWTRASQRDALAR